MKVMIMKKLSPKTRSVLSHLFAFVLGMGVFAVFLLVYIHTAPSNKLMDLESLIQSCFIGEADITAMEDAAADAMVDALGDRWSYYMTTQEYASYLETSNNAYVGIGITILTANDGAGFSIQSVTEGSGAAEAGLQPEDLVVAVDGQDVREMTSEELRALVRGEEGTFVEVTVRRESQRLTFTVERRRYETAVATGTLLAGNVGLVTIENFDTRCAQETIAAIEELMAQGADRIVFDVRNNPGGYAHELIEVLDYLLPEGEIFFAQYYDGYEDISQSDASFLDLPMAVLVNGDSYSAAEFFAATLQEYGAAVIVGSQTCGKGYFQQTFQLSDGSAVGLSVGKYYTPQGRNLAGIGVTPDISIDLEDDDALDLLYDRLKPQDDPQIQAAIEALK